MDELPPDRKGGRMTPVSRVVAKYEQIRLLPSFPEIHQKLADGWAPGDVADFIQRDRGEALSLGKEELVSMLLNYRNSLPPATVAQHRLPKAHAKALKKYSQDFDELEELAKLYHLQMERIDIDLKLERNIKKLFGTMPQEMRLALDMLARIAELKMDMGLNERHIGTIDVDAQILTDAAGRLGKESVSKVLANPQSRQKVLGIAERLLALAGRDEEGHKPEVVTLEAEVTGKEEDHVVPEPKDIP